MGVQKSLGSVGSVWQKASDFCTPLTLTGSCTLGWTPSSSSGPNLIGGGCLVELSPYPQSEKLPTSSILHLPTKDTRSWNTVRFSQKRMKRMDILWNKTN